MARRDGFPLSRRTLLRGAGVTLALPWLEAMAPAASPRGLDPDARDPGAPPVRFAALFMPNGVRPDAWTPQGNGADFTLSRQLEPLAGVRDDVLVFTNLWHELCSDTHGNHQSQTAGLLIGSEIRRSLSGALDVRARSLDQEMAALAGPVTPLPSIELGTEPARAGVDMGLSKVYGAHIAWRGPASPLAKEINPRLAFDRLVRAGGGGDGDEARRAASVLDLVAGETDRLRRRLGTADRHRVEEYLDSVRALEDRIDRATAPAGRVWTPRAEIDPAAAPPPGIPADHAEHVRLMLDLIVLAFRTDITRIATFMFGNAVSGHDFSFLEGVGDSHHTISHHMNNPDKLAQYEAIARWHVAQYAYLLKELAAVPEGGGTLLDNSMVLFGSELRDGQKHERRNLPILLGGRGGGRIASGRHLAFDGDTPLANLYVSMLEAFGTPRERFADSAGPLRGVLA